MDDKVSSKVLEAVKAFEDAFGNKAAAARQLGIATSTLKDRLTEAQRLGVEIKTKDPVEEVNVDRAVRKSTKNATQLKQKYENALKTIDQLETDLEHSIALKQGLETITIEPQEPSGTSEATAVWVASDWHIEETVGKEIGGLNKYTLEIADARVKTFFRGGLRLTDILAKDISIKTIVLALLGDYISGYIHEELKDLCSLEPIHAIVKAQNMIASGIQFILDNSNYTIVIPCHSGNHARTTKTTHFSSENGHSLEYLMFNHLASYFRDELRVQFQIAEGMHSYLQVYNKTIRFHHGHAIKYNGGVGGIYIPTNKAIAQWNKGRHADLDVFGHFHQMRDGGNFICNGSVIGYNGFALSIKADFEEPRQALFLMDKKRGKTAVWPILV